MTESWNALRKAWKAYRIAKVYDRKEDKIFYAKRIREIQDELGVARASFPDLGLTN